MKKWFFGLVAFLLVGLMLADPGWSQRRRSREPKSRDIDDLIYNEQVDVRSDEEKRSDADRLIEAVKTLREPDESERPETEPATQIDKPKEARTPAANRAAAPPSGGKESDGTAELSNQPTLSIKVPSPDMQVNQEMTVQVVFDNPSRMLYNALAYSIKYDPAVLEILDQDPNRAGVNINDASAGELGLDVGPKARLCINVVEPTEGLIHFMAVVPDEGFIPGAGVVGEFTIRALRERGNTNLKFENVTKGKAVADYIDGLRKNRKLDLNPITFLRVMDPMNKQRAIGYDIPTAVTQLRVLQSVTDWGPGEKADYYPTAIRLIPSKSEVRVGEEFDVLVQLFNPERVSIDAVSLYLLYDTRVLDVVDQDDNNLITGGTNIHDGDYHDKFPFEYCNSNQVNRESGEIDYSMATYNEPISSEGTFARIRFVAKRPVKSTGLLFGFNVPNRYPTTGVFRQKQDFLAKTDNLRDGVYSGEFRIRP